MFRSRSTTRLFQSWRGSQAAAFRSRRFGDSSTRNARSSGTTTRLAASKALPLLIGAGLAYLGYATFIQDGRVVREVFAEPAPSKWDGTESMRERLRTAMKDCGALDPYALESNSRMSAENKKLEAVSKLTVQGALRADTCQLPSNSLIGEDREICLGAEYNNVSGEKEPLFTWAVYDGHAGHQTADILEEVLAPLVLSCYAKALNKKASNDAGPRPDSFLIQEAIKEASLTTDTFLMAYAESAMDDPTVPLNSHLAIDRLLPALSGSCALLAFFQPATSMLQVACVGDSRAVLGRANWRGIYTAKPLSVDQTGFNPIEVARVEAEHPGEENIFDPKTGRLFGLAVSRAFGDARWKWPDERVLRAKNDYWGGQNPRPKNVVKTPPYLTAMPEITETKIVGNPQHPDFLIMASDGFWDHMSNENAVLCVQQWLEAKKAGKLHGLNRMTADAQLREELAKGRKLEQGMYRNEKNDGDLEWKIEPKHFVVEDENCAMHLVKNVLGGNRRALFCGLMALEPPFSRAVRDDITVHVIFFGDV